MEHRAFYCMTTSSSSILPVGYSRVILWAPFTFVVVSACLVEKIQRFSPRYNKWYMDDGGIISSADNLVAIWNMLIEKAPELGLELNPSKCEWSWLDSSCTKPCPIRVQGVRRDK